MPSVALDLIAMSSNTHRNAASPHKPSHKGCSPISARYGKRPALNKIGTMTTHLRIATYNLQKCVGMDMRRRPDRSLQVINALNADIITLQEADKRLPPRPAALPHDLIDRDGWQALDFGQPGGSLGWHGNAMLLRPGISITDTSGMDLPGLETRGAIIAELGTKIGPLRVIGVHLGLLRRHRLLQLMAITRELRRRPLMPTVIAGDFNEWGPKAALDAATPGLDFVEGGRSFPALRPVAALDVFAISDDLHAITSGVHRRRPATNASDHLPVCADIALT